MCDGCYRNNSYYSDLASSNWRFGLGWRFFGLPFVVILTIINVIRFIVEGIKTFNNDNVALEVQEITKGKKALKVVFSVVNVLLICAMIIHIAIEVIKTSNVEDFFVMFLYSAFYLVPFVIINTIKFIVFGEKTVFAENYKKPFKTIFLSVNILLVLAIIPATVILMLKTGYYDFEVLIVFAVFQTFLLAVFNGIKFIIDDIKSLHKN